MPYLTIDTHKMHYTDEGTGPEIIVFSHGLLFSGDMFAAQIEALKSHYRCITFDHRGQGKSAVSTDGYDIDTLTNDAETLIKELDLAPCHFVGLSMGGFVGMRLAIRKPELLKSLVLIETTADPEPSENVPRYRLLNFIARWFGLGVVVGRVMPIMFGQTFLADKTRATERNKWRRALADGDRHGITRAVRGVIDREGVLDDLSQISLPTLILVGDEDVATTPDKSERMHGAITGSELVTIPGAGHSSPIEEPQRVTSAIRAFLQR
ncbi:alpha/beta hydrolase [Aliiroseovarius sp. KMU-50]|uniref:Alpha/beta hydrolase n=1 Tax=Aliiroseovarius salicola TaxID=3009082 RepID=A0ABT4W022_9RHOB|nr:alpha/beta hydrolase [Aliiroseovarius sp. KMU-50]MDA5093866.1 alpha/beta hydrolase [Aliiroseovarius sp. KMU-50]